MEIRETQEGEHILFNLDNRGNGEFGLGTLYNKYIGPFYIGLDACLQPACVNIAFDPARSGNPCSEANQVGLYNVLHLRIDGFPVPGYVFPELSYTREYHEIYNHCWPAMVSMDRLKNAANIGMEGALPLFALNNVAYNPECTYQDLFSVQAPMGFLASGSPEEGQSSIATMRLPVGIDFLGPYEEELMEMLCSEGKEPFADMDCPEDRTFQSCIEEILGTAYQEFDRIQEYENLRLFQYRDSENDISYICVKFEERRILLFELESYEVQECQKKRMAQIFQNYKDLSDYRPIRNKMYGNGGKKQTVDYGSHILYEMDGASFVLSGYTYAVWMQNANPLGTSEYLTWSVKMSWSADKLNFEQCQFVEDPGFRNPDVITFNPHISMPCWERFRSATTREISEEGDCHQKIWFRRG